MNGFFLEVIVFGGFWGLGGGGRRVSVWMRDEGIFLRAPKKFRALWVLGWGGLKRVWLARLLIEFGFVVRVLWVKDFRPLAVFCDFMRSWMPDLLVFFSMAETFDEVSRRGLFASIVAFARLGLE